eukprot:CAMPEP_0172715910 /NCGR_PEP_ID=MMETSP1074-20121228/67816_1 /TAXON_ID=2916 /ORGANISM="Ceratium fusus, Strain PA161109" /LENGTH=94 /DNA_ID=CAMNT_0013540535 /DNA_START=1 /DNA_END=285 /DNA_ORIENTATION=+
MAAMATHVRSSAPTNSWASTHGTNPHVAVAPCELLATGVESCLKTGTMYHGGESPIPNHLYVTRFSCGPMKPIAPDDVALTSLSPAAVQTLPSN